MTELVGLPECTWPKVRVHDQSNIPEETGLIFGMP